MTITRTQMVEHDARTFALMREAWKTETQIKSHQDRMHQAAGDKKSRSFGRTGEWEQTFEQVRFSLTADVARGSGEASAMLSLDMQLDARLDDLNAGIAQMNAAYYAQPWPRYFPCLNADGHIHSSLRGCPTVRWDTDMGWATEMSGLTADQAIHGIAGQFEGLGETLCSVCFPEAPAEWCRTRSEVTRAEREAARREREEARYVKQLRDGEQFRTSDHDRITTVAACKALVRKPAETAVELEWYRSEDAKRRFSDEESRQRVVGNVTSRLEGEKLDAAEANRVLLAREAAVPGTGWTQADADRAIASATKRTRVAYFK